MGRDSKLYVRGVSERIGTRELREVFEKYGNVLNVQTGQAGFAFIEMEDEHDCYECIRALDNSLVDGQKISVEKARDKSYRADRDGRDGDRRDDSRRRDMDDFRCYNCNRSGHLARDCTEPPRNPLYADTRGTRIADLGGESRGREDRDRYRRRDDRYGRDRDYRDYRDDRDRGRSYDPRYDRDYRDRDYDSRRSPSRYSSSYRDRDSYSSRRSSYSPARGRSPDRGYSSYRGGERRSSRSPADRPFRASSRSPPGERPFRASSRSPSYRAGSRSPPRDRPLSPERSRENGEKDEAKPSSPVDGRRTPPDTL